MLANVRKNNFQIPDRIYMKDSNKDTWIDDLAKNQKGLAEIAAQKVPLIGTKEAKVLDLCVEMQVPLQRAIWFIKCVGYNEMVTSGSHAQRPQKSAPTIEQNTSFCKDWTKNVLQYFAQQLNMFSGDTAPKKGQSSTLPKEEFLRGKLSKTQYLIQLCRLQYDEDLLSPDTFLLTVLKIFQKNVSGGNQLAIMISLVSAFLSEYKKSRYLLKQLLLVCFHFLQKLKALNSSDIVQIQILQIRSLIQVFISF